MEDEPIYSLFRKMGLGGVDAKVYLMLLSRGPMSTPLIAEELGSYRSQVHVVLNRLLSKGFVEVSRGKPTLYRAVDPEVIIETFREETKRLEEEAMGFLSSIRKERSVFTHGVWILRSKMGLYRRFRKAIRDASVDIVVCGEYRFLKGLLKDLVEAQKRGIMVYTIIYKRLEEELDQDKINTLDALDRVKIAIPGDYFIVRDFLQAVLSQKRWRYPKEESYGLVVEEPILINYIISDFFREWVWGEEIKDKGINLPARFTIHKLALYEAERLLKRNKRLYGYFEGWWVSSSRQGRIEGRIIDTHIDFLTGYMHFVVETSNGLIRAGGPDATLEEFATREVLLKEGKD